MKSRTASFAFPMLPLIFALGTVLAVGLTSCSSPRSDSFAFLGVPESESGNQGPVGLINGKPGQVTTVSPVTETTYGHYELAKQGGQVFAEVEHGGYIYFAVKEQRDARFDNASAWVELIERFKARKP